MGRASDLLGSAAGEDRFGLSEGQVRAFYEEGFLTVPGVFAAAEVERMRAAFERLKGIAERLGESRMYQGSQFVVDRLEGAGGGPAVRIQRIVWCGAAEPVLSEYGKDPRLLRMAGQLLGSNDMQQLINQAHFKLPGDGVEFPWHQDSTHRRYGQGEWLDVNGRGSYVQTALALDEVTQRNGPLQLIPASCKLGHVEPPEEGWLPPELDPDHAVTATMMPGDVLLFGPYTFHRSMPNRSSLPRRVFINGFAYPGANSRVYPGEGAGRVVAVGVKS